MTPDAIAHLARAIARQKAAETRYYAYPSSPVREEILGRDLKRARVEFEAASADIPEAIVSLLVQHVEAE